MKKLLLVAVIIALVALLFYWARDTAEVAPESVAPQEFQPNPENATFSFDEGNITLSQGESQSETETFTLLKERGSGDLNNDGRPDSVVLIASSGGGSGVFIYIAAYVSGPVSYKGTNAVFIGDRITPQSVSIANGVATLRYLDRKPDEPFAAEPTVPVNREFVYKNGEFVEK